MKIRMTFAITLITILCGCDSQHHAASEAKPPVMDSEAAAQKALEQQQAEEQLLRQQHKGIQKKVANQLLLDASKDNNYLIAKVMLEYGADVNIKDSYGYVPLAKAANGGHLQIVNLLIANGANVNARDDYSGDLGRGTPLMAAAYEGHTHVVSALLKAGADPNLKNKSGWTALDYAIKGRSDRVVGLLKPVTKQ